MKKVFLAFSLMFIAIAGGFAQVMDFGLNLGYGFRTAGGGFTQSTTSSTTTYQPISYGAGFNIGINGAYWFGDHVGVGLDLTYVIGSRSFSDTSSSTEKINNSLFTITPMVLLSAHNEGINPYAKFGIAIGIPSFEDDYTTGGGTETIKVSGGTGLGFFAAFGLDFPISDNLIFNAEVFDRAMAWEPTKEVYTAGGVSQTTTLTNSVPNNQTSFTTQLTPSYPLSSVGILVGIKFRMGK